MVVTDNGVRIIGYTDLPGRLPTQASQLFGTNLVNLLKLLTPGQGRPARSLDFDDVVQRGMTVCRDGETTVAATSRAGQRRTRGRARRRPGAAGAAETARPEAQVRAHGVWPPSCSRWWRAYSPADFLGHFTVFALAVVVGFYVISNVHHALHTPLMSVTNAISGIILVGALLQIGSEDAARRAPSPSSRPSWPASTSSVGSR